MYRDVSDIIYFFFCKSNFCKSNVDIIIPIIKYLTKYVSPLTSFREVYMEYITRN